MLESAQSQIEQPTKPEILVSTKPGFKKILLILLVFFLLAGAVVAALFLGPFSKPKSTDPILFSAVDPERTSGFDPKFPYNINTTTDVAMYSVNEDGSELKKLPTNYPGLNASWGPGRSSVVFYVAVDKIPQIFIMKFDGAEPKQLTFDTFNKTWPTLSPDGSKLLYSVFLSDKFSTTTLLDLRTQQTKIIKDVKSLSGFDRFPHWSPGGDKFVFTRSDGDKSGIYTSDIEGNEKNLTPGLFTVATPAWSPSGDKIAYVNTGDGQVYIMNVDGTKQEKLTNDLSSTFNSPSWSPDSKKLVAVRVTKNSQGVTDSLITIRLSDRFLSVIPTGKVKTYVTPKWSP